MDITPQDLGGKWRKELLKKRALTRIRRRMGHVGANGDAIYSLGKPVRRTRLARFWLKRANLPEREASEIVPLLTYANTGVSGWRNLATTFSYTFFLWFVAMIAWSAVGSAMGNYSSYSDGYPILSFLAPVVWAAWAVQSTLFLPRDALRHINTDAVTVEEVEAFLPTARGELDRTYLNTVLETMRQPLPVATGQDIRTALRAVGDTVSVLPGQPIAAGADDAGVLRLAAKEKRQKADIVQDAVLENSLRRQAESDEKQAQIVEQGGTAAMRARARHDEAKGQLNTLLSVLTVYASPENAARIEQGDMLQDTVRRVAAGAIAAAEAKRELDDSELAALYAPSASVQPTQSVGIENGTGVPAPAPSLSTKWWQGTSGNS